MNELIVRQFEGEVHGPEDRVRVVGRGKPFKQSILQASYPSGLTVEDLLEQTLGNERSGFAEDYHVCVDGTPIPREWRARVRPKAGCTVTFAPRLQKDMIRNIALIAIAVLALFVPVLFPALSTLAATLISAGIVIGGSLAVNALFPVAPPEVSPIKADSAGRSKVYSIAGSRNTADPFGPIPIIYGRVRVWPRFAALPYTEFVGQTQYLRLLFCIGYGPIDITSLQIGQTPIGDLEGVSVEIKEGYDSDTNPKLYPGTVFQESLAIELTEDDWFERTTAEDIDEILIDISAPGGYYRIDRDTGKFKAIHAAFEAQYRAVGSGTWLDLDSYDDDLKKKEAWRIGFRQEVDRDQYEVRVRKTTDVDEDGDVVVQDLYWTGLTSIRTDPPIDFHKPLALVALRIKATGQLNNVIETFNCLASARVKEYDGTGDDADDWDEDTPSRNPAAAFVWTLQGPAIYETVPDEQIDWASLAGWHDYCDDEGWEYNFEHDRRLSVFDTLRMIAASGRARVVRTDGKWGVIWDEADVAVAQHFTPRNSWGFEEQRVYFDPPHAYRINFVNQAKDYQPDERKVYADGYNSGNATRFEALEFPGVTSSGDIWRLGRFHMAQVQLRPATYTLMTNWQALSCTVGSRVYVAHDVAEWGLAQARVVAVSDDTITIDEDFVFELGTEYLLRFRQADGTSVIRAVEIPDSIGAHRTITLLSGAPDPEVGDLVMFGEDIGLPAVLLRVQEIEWLPDLRARVTMVDDAPDIADADSGEIPEFDSQITAPSNLYLRPPTNLAVAEQVYISDGAAYADATLSWLALATYVTGFEIEMRDDNTTNPTFEPMGRVGADVRQFVVSDLEAGSYSFRVRSLFTKGTYSAWAELNLVTFTGILSRPDDVSNFRIAILGDTATLTWDAILGQAVAYYVIRHTTATSGAAWGSASILLERVIGSSVQVPAVNGTFLIKAVTSSGAESLDPAMIIYTGANLVVLNVVELVVPEPDWFGERTDLSIVANRLFLDAADVEGTFLYHDFVALGETFTSRVSPSILAFGNDPTNVMASWDTLLEVDSLAGSTPADWRVLLEERHLEEGTDIDLTLGSNIGDMTANGGLAAAFDGQQSETEANCAVKSATTSSYVGKTLAVPAAIAHAIIFSSSNNGFISVATGTLELYGKQGSAPANATDGTLLSSLAFTDVDAQTAQLLVSDDPDTVWDHAWVRYVTSSSSTMRCAELYFIEASGVEGWTDWAELRLSDITAQAYQFRLTLTSLNPAIDVHVEEADISIDMPDRIEAIGDLAVPNTGTTYTYSQPFRHVETVVVTAIQNATSGDYATISNRTEESFDIIVRNSANAGVARTVDAVAAGYGRRIS